MSSPRTGLLAAGNFIVDAVKVIDHYPAQDMLANILEESRSNGGGPYNVLKNLSTMQVPFPLAACGLTGADENGAWIRQDCSDHGIDVTQLHVSTTGAPTSYTDAMTVRSTGRRTFYHRRGANADFSADHCSFENNRYRLFHLAYLLLLDGLDAFAPDGRTYAAHLLSQARAAGLETSVDLVSTPHPRFREIALSALAETDHLILNETEAGLVTGQSLTAGDPAGLMDAARHLVEAGVRRTVTIHTPQGAVCAAAAGTTWTQPSLRLPEGFSKGATGAGDAFAAGLLWGIHEEWDLPRRLLLAVSAAAASLTHPSPSAGLRPVPDCLALADKFGFGSFS